MTEEEIQPPNPDSVPIPNPERVKGTTGGHIEAWKRVLEEMKAMAEDRRQDGWDVTTVWSAHTDTVSKDMGDDPERFGIFHNLPDNHGERFTEVYDPDEFTEYLAYGTPLESFMYLVTEVIDSDTKRSLFCASRYDMRFADGLRENAEEEGKLITHWKTIDGTILGRFEHDEYEPLLP